MGGVYEVGLYWRLYMRWVYCRCIRGGCTGDAYEVVYWRCTRGWCVYKR